MNASRNAAKNKFIADAALRLKSVTQDDINQCNENLNKAVEVVLRPFIPPPYIFGVKHVSMPTPPTPYGQRP